jgi:AGZA family xanthine/uracil permease-like MFS transporter
MSIGATTIRSPGPIEQGFLFTAMVLSATVVGVIERRWRRAAAWSAFAALSACGLMHSYQWTFGDTA